jgi:hypothetical protein
MDTVELKSKLHMQIEASDERLLNIVFDFMNEYTQEDGADADSIRKKLILAERENYLLGKSRSYTWEEVKKIAIEGKRK